MLINIKKLDDWLLDNPNYDSDDREMIMGAVSQFESDCIDREQS